MESAPMADLVYQHLTVAKLILARASVAKVTWGRESGEKELSTMAIMLGMAELMVAQRETAPQLGVVRRMALPLLTVVLMPEITAGMQIITALTTMATVLVGLAIRLLPTAIIGLLAETTDHTAVSIVRTGGAGPVAPCPRAATVAPGPGTPVAPPPSMPFGPSGLATAAGTGVSVAATAMAVQHVPWRRHGTRALPSAAAVSSARATGVSTTETNAPAGRAANAAVRRAVAARGTTVRQAMSAVQIAVAVAHTSFMGAAVATPTARAMNHRGTHSMWAACLTKPQQRMSGRSLVRWAR
mmetsp:Transcript_75132/g.207240  ORF Transcript_75132/g.207240 Transcript_75132/m.207240 type:complete len:299 (+) Transcript_75132:934-1830(+)